MSHKKTHTFSIVVSDEDYEEFTKLCHEHGLKKQAVNTMSFHQTLKVLRKNKPISEQFKHMYKE